jgi:hypothetical protein
MRSLPFATIAVVAVLICTGAATAAPSFVIRGDTRIGGFAVQSDGSLGTVVSFQVRFPAGGD